MSIGAFKLRKRRRCTSLFRSYWARRKTLFRKVQSNGSALETASDAKVQRVSSPEGLKAGKVERTGKGVFKISAPRTIDTLEDDLDRQSFANRVYGFRWKDRKGGYASRNMTLSADELLWRFLLHTLPGRFVRGLRSCVLKGGDSIRPRF